MLFSSSIPPLKLSAALGAEFCACGYFRATVRTSSCQFVSAFRAEFTFCNRLSALRTKDRLLRTGGRDPLAALQAELCTRRKDRTAFKTFGVGR